MPYLPPTRAWYPELLLTAAEMIEAEGRERNAIEEHQAGRTFLELTDASEREAFAASGDAGARPHTEQEFVVFAAVERLFWGGPGETRRHGDGGTDIRSEAQAVEVEGEAVAKVHGGGGAEAHSQKRTQFEAGLGAEMAGPSSPLGSSGTGRAPGQCEGRSAQSA
jgi:hypothetical protein